MINSDMTVGSLVVVPEILDESDPVNGWCWAVVTLVSQRAWDDPKCVRVRWPDGRVTKEPRDCCCPAAF